MTTDCTHQTGNITGIYMKPIERRSKRYGTIEIGNIKIRVLFNPLRKTRYKKGNISLTVFPNGTVDFSNLPVGNHTITI